MSIGRSGSSRRHIGAVAFVALTVALSGGCGSSTSIPATTATSPSTTATSTGSFDACGVVPGPGVTITVAVGACQVGAPVGTDIRIGLASGFDWDDPVSSSAAVRVEDVQRPVGGGLTAELVAAAPGRATVTSSGGVICQTGHACPALARLYRVVVTVSPA